MGSACDIHAAVLCSLLGYITTNSDVTLVAEAATCLPVLMPYACGSTPSTPYTPGNGASASATVSAACIRCCTDLVKHSPEVPCDAMSAAAMSTCQCLHDCLTLFWCRYLSRGLLATPLLTSLDHAGRGSWLTHVLSSLTSPFYQLSAGSIVRGSMLLDWPVRVSGCGLQSSGGCRMQQGHNCWELCGSHRPPLWAFG